MSAVPELFSIGEVSAMVALSAHTIRAWERRHGVVDPVRTASGHRRYTMADVETLKRVKHHASSRHISIRLGVLAASGESVPADPSALSDLPLSEAAQSGRPAPSPNVWRFIGDLDPRLVAVIDTRGRIFDCNVALARAAGALRFRLRGTAFIDLVEPYDRAKAVAIYRGALKERPNYEINLRTAGVAGLYSFDCVPLDEQGEPMIVCIGRELG